MDDVEVNRLAIRVPARGDHLAAVRNQIGQWLSDRGVTAELSADVVLAADEALTNCVHHGHWWTRDSAAIELTVAVDENTVWLRVVDRGQPPPPHTQRPGLLGLRLMKALAGRVDVTPNTHNTTITALFHRHRRRDPSTKHRSDHA